MYGKPNGRQKTEKKKKKTREANSKWMKLDGKRNDFIRLEMTIEIIAFDVAF